MATLMLGLTPLTGGAADDMPDDLPTSAVMWVCPDEPFAAGIGNPRHYRKTFETKEGLVKATGRLMSRRADRTFLGGTSAKTLCGSL